MYYATAYTFIPSIKKKKKKEKKIQKISLNQCSYSLTV